MKITRHTYGQENKYSVWNKQKKITSKFESYSSVKFEAFLKGFFYDIEISFLFHNMNPISLSVGRKYIK